MSITEDQALLEQADEGIAAYLKDQQDLGRITGNYYEGAAANTMPNLREWLLADELDRISPEVRNTLREAIGEGRWGELADAYARNVTFGTGGIREKMGATRDAILRLKEEGIGAPIIKGPNTVNDVVYLLISAAVAKYGRQRTPPLTKVVIGLDTRIGGREFSCLVTSLFLAYDYTVYLFDEPCPYPSVAYAVPRLRADIGVFISASHNDFRYNGYKLTCQNGSQFDPHERKELYERFVTKVEFGDIKTLAFTDAPKDRLWFLGGVPAAGRKIAEGEHSGLPLADPLRDAGDLYAGHEDHIIDLHALHAKKCKTFLLRSKVITEAARPLSIGYAAFNGAGRTVVPRLLAESGFKQVRRIMKLDAADGMFPAFCSDPGKEQQPDPGDWRAADIAVEAFKEEYPAEWDEVDLIIGTDPDADRCAVIVKVPEHQRDAYLHPGTRERCDYTLLSADDVWSALLWYRLTYEIERFGAVRDADKKFIALSNTTIDLLPRIARKFGLGVLRTWVGFAQLAAATRAIWDLHRGLDTDGLTEGGKLPHYDEGRRDPSDTVCNRTIHSWEAMDDTARSVNIAALEQSCGFSILGGVPPNERSLGTGGHVRDKDGTLAALLVAELAQSAKEQGRSLLDLIDEKIYLDPEIGLYVTHYEPDPLDGEYEGLAGYTKKRGILKKAEALLRESAGGSVSIGGLAVKGAVAYRTGKFDEINYRGFPDEGYRFYFDGERQSHLTIRPSGTSNALRFHVQLCGGCPTDESRAALIERKADLRAKTLQVVKDIRGRIGAVIEG